MINRLEINGIHLRVDDDLKRYVHRKIGRLDRYISRRIRQSVHVEVKLIEQKSKDKKECTCEATAYLPYEVINVHESTINMYAAVDIVETKLKLQLKKYKEMHSTPKLRHRFLAHIRRTSQS
ncbi:MAG TPA: ribosome-associated translation inhibitor RaiA [Candidatus Saccharimonadales bacterium]|nr:ribosome-associated translation inhibitor RaiA [Candidatus Saccharimonadales bacterium]